MKLIGVILERGLDKDGKRLMDLEDVKFDLDLPIYVNFNHDTLPIGIAELRLQDDCIKGDLFISDNNN